MAPTKKFRLLRPNENDKREGQIYCRRHNRIYYRCPVESNLRLCECLSQCEMAAKLGRGKSLRKTG